MSKENRVYISNKSDKFPFLASMYDPTDKGHTRGDIDYFIEEIKGAIAEWDDISLEELEVELAKLKELESLGVTYIVVEED